ncbi:MAG: ImmA/IrrE family metallo-endopeptidase [Cyanobacteria bacterium P01_F01_bin.150]
MVYQHPGHQFIQQHGLLTNKKEGDRYVSQYASFLRQRAKIENIVPVDLDRIYRHFEMPVPYRAPLVDQQGILVDGDAGIILIKEDDPRVRQRFTEGHELIELLFEAHHQMTKPSDQQGVKQVAEKDITRASELNGPVWQGAIKEKWCDHGAAELLMPNSTFTPQMVEQGFSFDTARTLSKLYLTSFMATLLHMLEYTDGSHAMVMWHWAVSRADQAKSNRTGIPPEQKLRVWWCQKSAEWTGGFIPRNKSIARPSCIIDTGLYQKPHNAIETFAFEKSPVQYTIEAMPIRLDGKNCVLSLLSTTDFT